MYILITNYGKYKLKSDFFHLYFSNMDISVTMQDSALNFSVSNPDILLEGSFFRILILVLVFIYVKIKPAFFRHIFSSPISEFHLMTTWDYIHILRH